MGNEVNRSFERACSKRKKEGDEKFGRIYEKKQTVRNSGPSIVHDASTSTLDEFARATDLGLRRSVTPSLASELMGMF